MKLKSYKIGNVKLVDGDRRLLKKWGYKDEEIELIEKIIPYTIYKVQNRAISSGDAMQILGAEDFLSGISRSAFHRNASKTSKYGFIVKFDSTPYYNLLNKAVTI